MKIRVGADFLISLLLIFILSGFDYAAIFLLSGVIHETGHIAFLALNGVKKGEMRLGLLGAEIKADISRISYMREISVYLGGIIFNLLTCVLCLFLLKISFDIRLILFFFSNLLYALVNLVPIKSFDGGGALRAILLISVPDMMLAEKISNAVSVLFSVILLVFSVVSLLKFGSNLTLVMLAAWCVYQCIPSKPCCLSAS